MKTNFFILVLMVLGGFSAKAQSVPMYLLELESHTKWDAVDAKWNSIRTQWVANIKTEKSTQKIAQLLLQFESYVKWKAVEVNWSSRRNAWVNECSLANSIGKVVKLLIEFESNLKWSAVDEKWKTRRTAWVNELDAIYQTVNFDLSSNIESGSPFKFATIGNQVWMAENLNVDRFINGDPIPQVKTETEWETAKMNKQPAWWYGSNEEEYGVKYGKLYNWYAVNDPRGLAPAGWHIPGEDEWRQLYDYLGYAEASAPKLRSKQGWDNNKNGTNESGFSALPGGNSSKIVSYNTGNEASWWSTTEFTPDYVTVAILKEYDSFEMGHSAKYRGNAVRCIKNK